MEVETSWILQEVQVRDDSARTGMVAARRGQVDIVRVCLEGKANGR